MSTGNTHGGLGVTQRMRMRGVTMARADLLRAKRAAAWLWTVSATACGMEDTPGLPNDVEWRSEHFVYHSRADDPDVCPALLEQLEQHFEAIRSATGLSWPE